MSKENRRSEAEHLAYQVQVESLEKAITEQKEAIEQLSQKVAEKDECWEREKKELHDKYETELSVVSKQECKELCIFESLILFTVFQVRLLE